VATSSERKPISAESAPGRNFVTFKEPTVPTIYADGVGGMILGPTICKMDLFTTVAATEAKPDDPLGPRETREVIGVLAMPTNQLVEMCFNILNAVRQNGTGLLAASEAHKGQLAAFLKSGS
jgi:hypothetical protein